MIKRQLTFLIAALATLSLLAAGCASSPTAPPTLNPTQPAAPINKTISTIAPVPSATPVPLAVLNFKPGDFYFSMDGKPAMVFVRNITGKDRQDFATMLDWAHQGGTRLIRIHLTAGWWGDPWMNKDWSVDEKWAQDWEWFFDQAQADGIYVMPVFGVWFDWNNNVPDYGGGLWQYNPINQANGGPLKDPGEIFQPDSTAHKMWMAWVKTLVERWQGRKNILAWEIFSEINLASGAPGPTDAIGAVTAAAAIDFANEEADVIHKADTFHRPLTLSLAGIPWTGQWIDFYRLNAIDFIQVHPYPDKLDRGLLLDVQKTMKEYNKPVLIGESGQAGDLDKAQNAPIGIVHAIWAAVVSGAMDARSLWWHDGNEFLIETDRAKAMQFMQPYATAELPAANFVNGVDFTGFKPMTATSTSGVWGATLGNESSVIGWYRDAQCEPPDWNLKPVISKQTVTITVPGSAANWKVDFYDTKDGTTIMGSVDASRKGKTITVPLPDFKDDIAFKMYIH